jgi:uncharacterized phage protein (TIGR01671 family)
MEFRAWSSVNQEMWSWEQILKEKLIEYCILENGEEVDVLLYTGLLDKTGRKIFEGDILVKNDYPFYSDGEHNYVALVVWEYAAWYYDMIVASDRVRGAAVGSMLDENGDGGREWEIIGNKFENPELLK